MHFFWPDQGWRHAQGMLHYELDQLSTHFTRSALVQEPGHTAHRLVEQGYDWLFVKSGLLELSMRRQVRSDMWISLNMSLLYVAATQSAAAQWK